ncbi:broad-complex core protein isoforms 1/2/3/4/5-like isoform X9 [Portunus trituberculatus]|uniref:broad-complex core protein isoforms 1/2/3/4/5-like isoform X9 n=1 Tax=Portunus trituberculatus TaxID=210409 RepID=UPI001E1D1B3F|nr:broad-complex core protein isoforms 1/2/3/4/5-like isoform X9 [Portunus trituberculatus]
MGSEQHYSLRWNDYTVKIVTAFQSLRDEEDFVDVTVACDGHSYSAHKMVLSACSPYFRSLLRANPCQHPIVILKDVGHVELERLLEFMYNGEVSIAQDQLAAFLKTAENLKIRGLAGSSDEMDQAGVSDYVHRPDVSYSYSSSSVLGGGVTSDRSSPSAGYAPSQSSKDDEMVGEGYHRGDSPPAKRRKRSSAPAASSAAGHADSTPASHTTEGVAGDSSVEVDSGGTMGGGGLSGDDDGRLDRREMKSEPDVSALMAIANAVQAGAPSDRPMKCPLCLGIIKQARNLRRHVFKRHLPAARRGEITEADVKNVLESKLKAITVTPLTEDELRQVQQRGRRKAKSSKKKKGIAALPDGVNGANINESEVTIRKLPQKKDGKKDKGGSGSGGGGGTASPVSTVGGDGAREGREDILQEALAARDKNVGQDEVMDLATNPQQLPPISVVVSHAGHSATQAAAQTMSLASGIHPRIPAEAALGAAGVRLQTDSPLSLHRDLPAMPAMAFEPQVTISEGMVTYHTTSPSQVLTQTTSPSPSASGYAPASYWSPSGMGLSASTFQPHQSVFAPAHSEYFTAGVGVHMARPSSLERMQQHRRKPYQ